MRKISNEQDFQQCRAGGRGYIYNDFSRTGSDGMDYNILHVASCGTLARANTNVDKYFADDLADLVMWLDSNRRNNWRRCAVCAP
jgi:hypothetical protein